MSRRLARTAALAALLLLTGCASAAPVSTLDDAPAESIDPTGQVTLLTTMLTELYAHGLDAGGTPTSIISDGATVAVAVNELTSALDLGEGARDFAAATAFELSIATDEPADQVDVATSGAEIVGSHDGQPVATVRVVLSTSRTSGPTTEATVTYALLLDGDRLADVETWAPGLDSGVGLASPTGAAQRFLDLVHAGDREAARFFSDDVNTDAQLEVLATATDDDTRLVELPQAQLGSAHVVYALDPQGSVLGRFEVLLGSQTRVVYSPTA